MRPLLITKSVVNTTLAGSASGLTALLSNLIYNERRTGEPLYKLSAAMNGCLAGLASITGSCGVIEPWAATIIGVVAGQLYLLSSHLLGKWCIDDAVDAIPVHFTSGVWGVIATGLFASPSGLAQYFDRSDNLHVGWFYSWGRGSGDASLLGCQIIGILFIIGWVCVIMTPFFIALNYFGMFRADGLEEVVGLDISYHGWSPDVVSNEVSQNQLEAYYKGKGIKRHDLYLTADTEDPERDYDSSCVDRFE